VDNGEAASWLDKRQAARVLGLSADGVRKRAIRGLIEHRKANDGTLRYLIPADMVEEVSEDRPQTSAETSSPVSGQATDTALLVENARLAERLAAEERRSTELQGALTELRAVLGREQARGDRLEVALVEARKGWLERLLEAVRKR
jgi:hypothetical protein